GTEAGDGGWGRSWGWCGGDGRRLGTELGMVRWCWTWGGLWGKKPLMNHKTRSRLGVPQGVDPSKWQDWTWQLRASLKEKDQMEALLSLTPEEMGYFS